MAGFRLSRWLGAYGRRKWKPGRVDCLMALADYAVALGHRGPAAHLRGTYRDEEGFRAIIAHAGGAVPLVGSCVARIGGEAASEPLDGTIAVIGSATELNRQWGAIRHEGRWHVRMNEGFAPLLARPLAMWRI